MGEIKVLPDVEALTSKALEVIIAAAQSAIQDRGQFSMALSGGSTPETVYRALAAPENRTRLDWAHMHLFWGDERHVPPNHPDSNFRMVKEHLLAVVPIPDENVHRVPAEMEVRMAAFHYEEVLRQYFDGEWPRFDLVLLGMGEDGHTASLFPHSAGLNEEQRWFIANYAPKRKDWRLTLTKNAINAARNIIVLVLGDVKADRLRKVLTGPEKPEDNPIQLIRPSDGQMVWLLDREAAKYLPDDLRG